MRTRRSYLWFSVVAVFSCVLVGQSHADDEAIRKKASESVERMSRSEFEVVGFHLVGPRERKKWV